MAPKKAALKKTPQAKFLADPTLATTDVVIDGKVYRMCFDMQALGQAEEDLIAEGHDVQLLLALPKFNIKNTLIIFAASIRRFHPEISYEDAVRLVTLPYVYTVAAAIQEAWKKAMPDAASAEDGANPIQPGS